MSATIRPEADFLRRNEKLLNDTRPRCDVLLMLSFQRWLDTGTCKTSQCAAILARSNIQFTVTSDTDFKDALEKNSPQLPILVIEQLSALNAQETQLVSAFQNRGGRVVESDQPDWLGKLDIAQPAIQLDAPSTLRAVVADQKKRTIVHLYNLGVERLSSFEDKVLPARNIRLAVRVPFMRINSVRVLTVDAEATSGHLDFHADGKDGQSLVKFAIPRVDIGSIVLIEGH